MVQRHITDKTKMLKLHSAISPGLVGKGEPGTKPAISMKSMLDLIATAKVGGHGYELDQSQILNPEP